MLHFWLGLALPDIPFEKETHSTSFPRENSYYIILDCESSAYQKLHQNSTNFIDVCYSYVIYIYTQNVNEKN